MACYIISYDLKIEGQSYNALYEKIKNYGTWAHITESTWAIVSNATAREIYNNLIQVMDYNDSLFIIKSAREANWNNVLCRNTWLLDNL